MRTPNRSKIDWWSIVLAAVSIAWLAVAADLACQKSLLEEELDVMGTYVGGAFAPIAFLWLVRGYFLQSAELAVQVEELVKQVAATNDMASSAKIDAVSKLVESLPALVIQKREIDHNPTFRDPMGKILPAPKGRALHVLELRNKGAFAGEVVITGLAKEDSSFTNGRRHLCPSFDHDKFFKISCFVDAEESSSISIEMKSAHRNIVRQTLILTSKLATIQFTGIRITDQSVLGIARNELERFAKP